MFGAAQHICSTRIPGWHRPQPQVSKQSQCHESVPILKFITEHKTATVEDHHNPLVMTDMGLQSVDFVRLLGDWILPVYFFSSVPFYRHRGCFQCFKSPLGHLQQVYGASRYQLCGHMAMWPWFGGGAELWWMIGRAVISERIYDSHARPYYASPPLNQHLKHKMLTIIPQH